MKVIGRYINGNYKVTIFDDGTKIRENDLDNLTPAFAENCDVCLTKKCSQNCSFCYEGCTPEGKHADIMNQEWIHTLHPYTELAINGNDMDHPQLIEFLETLREQKVIANITVNQNQFMANKTFLHALVNAGLIHGVGVSLNVPTLEFIKAVGEFPTAVVHTIAGILTEADIKALSNYNLKVLILGYKNLGRGVTYKQSFPGIIKTNMEWLKNNLKDYIGNFNVVSFDNLAIEQLDVRSMVDEDKWDEFFMGDDGGYTFYLDCVNETFSKNSVAPENERYYLMSNVDDMFQFIRNNGIRNTEREPLTDEEVKDIFEENFTV